jgi:hypothetical protein
MYAKCVYAETHMLHIKRRNLLQHSHCHSYMCTIWWQPQRCKLGVMSRCSSATSLPGQVLANALISEPEVKCIFFGE